MIRRLLYFFRGYLLIEISGNALERFINQIINSNINLWGVKRINKNKYVAKIGIADYNRLRPLVRKRLCTVKIKEKYGYPFAVNRVRKRMFLFIGLILFFAIFWTASSFLWFINIDGLDNLTQEKVLNILKDSGVRKGVLRSDLNLNNIEKTILKKEPKISWIDLSWQGTRLNVEVVEKKEIQIKKTQEITANKSGVIKELIVLKGQPVVKEGDTVTKGQTLIVPDDSTAENKVKGIINADVWYEGTGSASISETQKIYTGNRKTIYGVKYKGKIYRFFSKPSFTNYLLKRRIESVPEWRNIKIPVQLVVENYREIELLPVNRNKETALFLAREKALAQILQKISSNTVILHVIEDEINTKNDNEVKVKLILKAEENIAASKNSEKNKEDFSD